MTEISVLIRSLQACASGKAEMCRECHLANLEDCSQKLTGEAADALKKYHEEEWEESDEPSDFDLEMGFDPYEGCYTFDC